MQFKDVIGQQSVKERLIRSVKSERISHAQLFFGPPGTGKLAMAIAYAQYICCKSRSDTDSCGTCPSCLKMNKLAHPDLHFVFPVVTSGQSGGKSVSDNYISFWREAVKGNPYLSENQWYEIIGAENKQGFISRNESSEVLRKLSLKSYESEYKVLIMWLAEKMNASAANTLLKLIEEPPDKTLFLIVSENTELILPTILSRTQMVRMGPPDPDSMRMGLLEQYPEQEEMVYDVLRRSNGNYGLAIKIMESDDIENQYFEEFVLFMRKCYARDIVHLRRWAETIAPWGREKIKDFLTYSLRLIRENFMLNLQQHDLSFLSEKEADFSQKFSDYIHEGNVFELVGEFEKAISHIEANGAAKLVLFDLAVKNILLLKRTVPQQ
ncbi:MAG: DNA polymerase III subunit [Bacteroidales bacterium]|nr:DNA polymerase III subunit [Bacteroidales bacterium]